MGRFKFMSLAWSLRGALGVPSTKVPISVASFAAYVLPPILSYVLVAVLAVTQQTRTVRMALCPVVVFLTFRAVSSVDMSLGNPQQKFLNVDLLISMLVITINTLSWSSSKKPLVRYFRPVNSSPSIIMDVLDLITTFRGHGWNWSRGLYVPRDTRPTNRIAFGFYSLCSAIVHALICGALSRAIYVWTGGDRGSSIFDETLPFFARYFRSSIISVSSGFQIYTVIQMGYDASTAIGVLLFCQDPAQWPPAFDKPWCATSLNDFWGRRWHQLFRHLFLCGAYPFSLVFGRLGMIIGAFLTSGFAHYVMMSPFERNLDFWSLIVGFGMMAPGMLLERAYYKLTGKRVSGVVGWCWTLAWLLLWGNLITDAFGRAGLFTCSTFIDSKSPFGALAEKLVIDLDAWLHTL